MKEYSKRIKYLYKDTCTIQGVIYQCINKAGTTGDYNLTHWEKITQDVYLEDSGSSKLYYAIDGSLSKKEVYTNNDYIELLQTKDFVYNENGDLISFTITTPKESITKELIFDIDNNLIEIKIT